MTITRVTAVWSGFSGAPGYTNFFFDSFGTGDEVDLEVARVEAFFTPLAAELPNDLTVTVQGEAAFVDETTGELLDYAQATGGNQQVEGTASGGYAAPVGAAVTWNTETVARGRRLRGRTFIVPMRSSAYEDDGTLTLSALANLNNAAAALIGDGSGPTAVIWSRPRAGAGGSIGPITSARVADKVAVLRSRRD